MFQGAVFRMTIASGAGPNACTDDQSSDWGWRPLADNPDDQTQGNGDKLRRVAVNDVLPSSQETCDPLQSDGPADEPLLDAVLAGYAEQMAEVGFQGVVVLAPEAFSPSARVLIAAHPAELLRVSLDLRQVEWKGLQPFSAEHGSVATCPTLNPAPLEASGYRSWVSVRIPVARKHYEILLLANTVVDDARAARALWDSMPYFGPLMRLCAEKQVPVTPRQRACLESTFQGLTPEQTAAKLGVSKRTVDLHLTSSRKKFMATSTMIAVARAHMIGLI